MDSRRTFRSNEDMLDGNEFGQSNNANGPTSHPRSAQPTGFTSQPASSSQGNARTNMIQQAYGSAYGAYASPHTRPAGHAAYQSPLYGGYQAVHAVYGGRDSAVVTDPYNTVYGAGYGTGRPNPLQGPMRQVQTFSSHGKSFGEMQRPSPQGESYKTNDGEAGDADRSTTNGFTQNSEQKK